MPKKDDDVIYVKTKNTLKIYQRCNICKNYRPINSIVGGVCSICRYRMSKKRLK